VALAAPPEPDLTQPDCCLLDCSARHLRQRWNIDRGAFEHRW